MPPKSDEQQTTAKIALAAKKKGPTAISKLKDPAKSMAKMTIAQLEKFAKGKIKKEAVKESITMQQPVQQQQMPQQMMQQMEPEMPSHEHPGCEDSVGDIFVVLKPTPDAGPEDLVHQTHAFGMGQYDPTKVYGVYQDGEEANIVAEAACNELYKHMKEVEDKKHSVTEKIERMIAKMQREVNNHMKSGNDQHAQMMLEKISGLRNQHKMVQSSKKELKPREEK